MMIRAIVFLAACGVLLSLSTLPSRTAFGASFVVDTTADDPGIALQGCTGAAGDCSLRGAITRANAASSPGDVITFGVSGTITLGSGLPLITGGGDTIDATGGDVIIDGNGIDETQNFVCLYVISPGNTIKGLKITDCAGAILTQTGGDNNTIGPGNVIFDNGSGIAVGDVSGNTVIGNKVGTDATGTAMPADFANITGVSIIGDDNTIGGTDPADRNIISGNSSRGIFLQVQATGNHIHGNYIGTDATGTVDFGNVFQGVLVQGSGNTIGGTNAGEGNLISGNTAQNIQISGEAADGNVIAGNIVGPDTNGSGAAMSGGGTANIWILDGADANIMGPGNVISDGSFGVRIENAGTTGNVVTGNKIGTNPAGTAAVPNTASGVAIFGASSGNTVGGTAPGDGNVIAFNGFNGVIVSDNGVENQIRGNSIHDNADIEINNLSGGNFEIAPPAINAAGTNAVGGTACANCEVDVFSDGVADAEFYEGSVTANSSGQWALYTSIAGPKVTATNTDTDGNTSELSAAVGFVAADADGDGVPNTLDNCSAFANSNQADTDGDGAGDVCDTDDDGDALDDISDSCPILAEDFDGFEDTNGCPDPDNDLDGICDAGQTSISCSGSDSGPPCFDPAGTLSCPTQDCRNVVEDVDAFKDSDGCPEPDNDNDGFPDPTDDCPGTDAVAGGDGMLGSPQDANHNGVQDGAEANHTTDDSALTFEDYDGVIDTDGCHDSPGDDYDGDGLTDETEVFTTLTLPGNPDTDADTIVDGSDNCANWPNTAQNLPNWPVGSPTADADCDGFTSAAESTIGTDPTRQCPGAGGTPDSWPADLVPNGTINILDVTALKPVFGQSVPPASARYDIAGGGSINILDVTALKPFFGKTCS